MRSTVESAPGRVRPVIRLRPVPRFEPPFDDELPPQVWGSGRQLPLDWSVPPPAPPDGPAEAPPVVAGPSRDARLAVRRFVHLCVEVLNGYRPAGHLRQLTRPSEAAGVVAVAVAGARRVTELRNASRVAGQRPRRPAPVGVLRVWLCEPRPGAVEAAVALMIGERTWAMALRMELHQQSWTATTLRLI